MESIDKVRLIKKLSDKTGYTIKDTRHFLNAFISIFAECILEEIPIDVRGFLHLYYQVLPARTGFVPVTGKPGEGHTANFPETTRVIVRLARNLRQLGKFELVDEEVLEEEQT